MHILIIDDVIKQPRFVKVMRANNQACGKYGMGEIKDQY